MEAAMEGKGLINYVFEHPAISLGAVGGVTAGTAFLFKSYYDSELKEAKKEGKNVKEFQKKVDTANTAVTVGLSFLGIAVLIAGFQQIAKR